jgi:hypothetical protein
MSKGFATLTTGDLPGPIPRTVLEPASTCVLPLEQAFRETRLKYTIITYASWMERAQRFRLFAIASSSRISSSEDAFKAILA